MSYVASVLQPGERVIVLGRLHWIVYWHAIALLVLGLVLIGWELAFDSSGMLTEITVVVFAVLVIASFVKAWFVRWITEIAVTDRRIIYKRGFITRHTAEMNMDKVSSVDVDQSLLGRILDYGSIHVLGSGGSSSQDHPEGVPGIEHLHRIAQPLALRNAIIAK